MSLEARVAATGAIVKRDVLIFASYRWRALSQNLGIIFSLALFYYLSQLVRVSAFPSSEEYFAFVVIGLVILQVLQSTFDAPGTIRQELVAGTFERMVVSPFGPVNSILALLVFPLAYSLLVSLATLLLAVVIFGLSLQWSTVPLALPVAVLGAFAFAPISLFFVAVTLRFKQAPGQAYVLTAISLVAGLYFPVTLLPWWIRWTSEVQPFTPAVDLLRHLLVGLPLQGRAWVDLAKLVGFAVVLMPLSIWLLSAMVRQSRATGTIIEY